MTTHLVANRQEALRVGFEATDWSRPVDFESFAQAMEDWDVRAIERDGRCIGAAFVKGSELHISVLPEWRGKWFTKNMLRELFDGKLVTTRVMPGHEYMYDILARLGFVQTEDGAFVKGH